MERPDARAYLRSLAAQHLAFVAFAMGGLIAFAGLPAAGTTLIGVGVTLWCGALLAGVTRSVRRGSRKPVFGGDGLMADSNWWLGWGPMADAAAAVDREPAAVRRAAMGSLIVGAAAMVLWFPVAALAS